MLGSYMSQVVHITGLVSSLSDPSQVAGLGAMQTEIKSWPWQQV